MRRLRVLLSTATLPAIAALVLFPAVAPAQIVELGQLPEGVSGSCPDNCQAVSRTTGYQAKVGPDRTLYQAPANGRIVAWTIALGNPGPKQTAFFAQRLGGESQATVVVLEARPKLVRRVVAKGAIEKLNGYFGQRVQFPLARSLPIRKGQYVGLTVPSWAPVLQLGLGADTSWRASRTSRSCGDPTITSQQTALIGRRGSAEFGCLYKTTRVTYSATFIPNPTPQRSTARSSAASRR